MPKVIITDPELKQSADRAEKQRRAEAHARAEEEARLQKVKAERERAAKEAPALSRQEGHERHARIIGVTEKDLKEFLLGAETELNIVRYQAEQAWTAIRAQIDAMPIQVQDHIFYTDTDGRIIAPVPETAALWLSHWKPEKGGFTLSVKELWERSRLRSLRKKLEMFVISDLFKDLQQASTRVRHYRMQLEQRKRQGESP